MAIGAASGKHSKPLKTKVPQQAKLRTATPPKATKNGGSKILAFFSRKSRH